MSWLDFKLGARMLVMSRLEHSAGMCQPCPGIAGHNELARNGLDDFRKWLTREPS